MPKVIGISGSERLKGNTEQFVQRALDIISEHGIETELITLADKEILGGCTGCIWCRRNRAECNQYKDDFNAIWRKMYEADGIVLGAPCYVGSVPAKMKAVLERATLMAEGRKAFDVPVEDIGWPDKVEKPNGLFHRKIGGAIAVTRRTGANATLAELLMFLMINNFIVVGSSYWTVGIGTKRLAEKPGAKTMKEQSRNMIETDVEGAVTIRHFAENFAWLVNKTKK